jgi:sugar O-acyltransferase (sialic acid O-acetyltransferase NeuD family)
MPVARRLVIVGAGGFGRETRELVRAVNAVERRYEVLGFVDDQPALWGTEIAATPVLGAVETVLDLADVGVVLTTGHPGDYFSRKKIAARLQLPDSAYPTLIHPSCNVASSTTLGAGTVLLAGVVTTAHVSIGRHVVVMPGMVATHDDVIGDFATFGAGVHLAGRVTVGEGAYLGAGALVREDRSIGPWSLIGMGSVVTRDVPPGEVWAGVPARRMRTVENLPG